MRSRTWLAVLFFASLRTSSVASVAPVRGLTRSAETCDEGLTCPSRNRSAREGALDDCQACEGYYLVSPGVALRCDLFLDSGGSACLGNNACAEGHRGFMCGACEADHSRRGGRYPCKPCSRFGTRSAALTIACLLLLHTFMHAVWGTVLGVLAVGAAISVKRLHLLILRILMQWVAVSTALFAFDFNDTDTTAPEWVRPFLEHMRRWNGSTFHGLPDPPFLLDCLVHFLTGGPSGGDDASLRRIRAILPVTWWLALPLFTLLWQVIICILVAKVMYPLSLYADWRLSVHAGNLSLRSGCYEVFGLFRDTSLASVFVDSLPILLVGLYSVWGIVTIGLLTSMQSTTYLQEQRWLIDPGVRWGEAEHTAVATLAVSGLILFSFGMNVALYMQLRKRKKQLRKFDTLRTYGFFFNGFEPDWYHWELVHKRMDVLAVYVVAYSNVIPSVQGRLLLCMTFAGFAWACHCEALPFDDRQNELLDQCERYGLRTRFMSVFMLQMFLLLKSQGIGPMADLCVAVLFVANAWYLLLMGMLLFCEFPMESTAGQFGGVGSRCWALLRRASCALASEKTAVAELAPSFEWRGLGKGVTIVKKQQQSKLEHFSSLRGVLRYLIRRIYRLAHSRQLVYASKLFGKILQHLITNAQVERMPGAFVDFVFLLAMCLRSHPLEVDVDTMLGEVAQVCAASPSSSDDVAQDSRTVCAEDLSRALLYLHRQGTDEIRKLLNASIQCFHDMTCDSLLLEIESTRSRSAAASDVSDRFRQASPATGGPAKSLNFDFEETPRAEEAYRQSPSRVAGAVLRIDLEERLEVATRRAEAAESQLNRLVCAMRRMGLEAQLAELAEGGDETAPPASCKMSDVSGEGAEEVAAELVARGIARASRRVPSRASEPEDEVYPAGDCQFCRHCGSSFRAGLLAEAAEETPGKAPVVSREALEKRSAESAAHETARTNQEFRARFPAEAAEETPEKAPIVSEEFGEKRSAELAAPAEAAEETPEKASVVSGEAVERRSVELPAHAVARRNQEFPSPPRVPHVEVSEPLAHTDAAGGAQERGGDSPLLTPRTLEAWRRAHLEAANIYRNVLA